MASRGFIWAYNEKCILEASQKHGIANIAFSPGEWHMVSKRYENSFLLAKLGMPKTCKLEKAKGGSRWATVMVVSGPPMLYWRRGWYVFSRCSPSFCFRHSQNGPTTLQQRCVCVCVCVSLSLSLSVSPLFFSRDLSCLLPPVSLSLVIFFSGSHLPLPPGFCLSISCFYISLFLLITCSPSW